MGIKLVERIYERFYDRVQVLRVNENKVTTEIDYIQNHLK